MPEFLIRQVVHEDIRYFLEHKEQEKKLTAKLLNELKHPRTCFGFSQMGKISARIR